MKPIFLFLCIAILLGGCNGWTGSTPECKTYLKGLQEDWTYDPEKRIYSMVFHDGRQGKEFLFRSLFDNKDCLLGRSKAQIEKLLGKPSKVDGGTWLYYLMGSCHSEKGYPCDFIKFAFDTAGLLGDIYFGNKDLSH